MTIPTTAVQSKYATEKDIPLNDIINSAIHLTFTTFGILHKNRGHKYQKPSGDQSFPFNPMA